MSMRAKLIVLLLVALLPACGNRTFSVSIEPAATETPSRLSFPVPPTRTPGPTALPLPTLTPFPTFTPLPTPTSDPLRELERRFEAALVSPNGRWSATSQPASLLVVNETTGQVWTLPCDLFKECRAVTPIKWTSDSDLLYFAPEAGLSETPIGIRLYTAVARIDAETGQWEKVLEETRRYYDFAVSSDDAYLAYTQPAGTFADNHSVVITIRNLRNRQEEKYTLDGYVGGNIVWSPFTARFVFQVQSPGAGSSIVYYDVEAGLLKYILREEQSHVLIDSWGRDNLVAIRKVAWSDRALSGWVLNPFTNEITPGP